MTPSSSFFIVIRSHSSFSPDQSTLLLSLPKNSPGLFFFVSCSYQVAPGNSKQAVYCFNSICFSILCAIVDPFWNNKSRKMKIHTDKGPTGSVKTEKNKTAKEKWKSLCGVHEVPVKLVKVNGFMRFYIQEDHIKNR